MKPKKWGGAYTKMKKIFAITCLFSMLIIGTTCLFAANENDYKNNLLKVEVTKNNETSYDIGLYTQKVYTEPVKVIKKSDTMYYLLLPETSNSVTSTPSLGNVKNVSVKAYPYAGQDLKNGYTKVAIITDKPVNFTTSLKTLDASVSPRLNPTRLARLDKVFERYSERLAQNNIPTPLAQFRQAATKTASKPVTAQKAPVIAAAPSKVAAPVKTTAKKQEVKPATAQKTTPVKAQTPNIKPTDTKSFEEFQNKSNKQQAERLALKPAATKQTSVQKQPVQTKPVLSSQTKPEIAKQNDIKQHLKEVQPDKKQEVKPTETVQKQITETEKAQNVSKKADIKLKAPVSEQKETKQALSLDTKQKEVQKQLKQEQQVVLVKPEVENKIIKVENEPVDIKLQTKETNEEAKDVKAIVPDVQKKETQDKNNLIPLIAAFAILAAGYIAFKKIAKAKSENAYRLARDEKTAYEREKVNEMIKSKFADKQAMQNEVPIKETLVSAQNEEIYTPEENIQDEPPVEHFAKVIEQEQIQEEITQDIKEEEPKVIEAQVVSSEPDAIEIDPIGVEVIDNRLSEESVPVSETVQEQTTENMPENTETEVVDTGIQKDEVLAEESEYVDKETEEFLEQLSTPIDAQYEDEIATMQYRESQNASPVEEEDSATIVASSKLTETRGLYLAKFEGSTSLVGYIQDDIYVLYNFGDMEIKNADIQSSLAQENDTDSLYIVRTGGKKLMVKSTPYDMSLEMVM